MQLFPSQQPDGHEVALQTQPEPLQVWPLPHEKHPTPPDPQYWSVVPALQVLPSQHPPQLPPAMHSHWWLLQSRSLVVQSWQAPPPLPQFPSVVPALQVVPSQQPEEQEVALQSQDPLLQYWPASHGTH
jgi:hypothetical protein